MDMQCDSEEVARAFGPYRLLPGKRLLLRGTEPMRIGSRALEILVTLVESAGKTVEKRELIARVWPTMAVEEGALRVHVAALRKLLGGGRPGSARYIESVTGQGYRFVASVTPGDAAQHPDFARAAAMVGAVEMPIGQDGKRVEHEGVAWVVGVGASRGNGAAVARRFAREGFEVAITGRSSESLQAIAAEIEAAGGHAIAVPGDVRKESDILEILGRLETIGPVDVGIYNAGNAIWGPPLETSSADFEAVWRVGCFGGFVFGREVARVMLQRGRGTIIFTGASASLRGKAAFAAFAAAKAGLRAVSQSFAREFGPRGIHVAHAIIDGSVNGDKILRAFPDIAQRKGPDGLLSPEAIADAYWYLHTQHRSAWSQEIDLRPYAESF